MNPFNPIACETLGRSDKYLKRVCDNNENKKDRHCPTSVVCPTYFGHRRADLIERGGTVEIARNLLRVTVEFGPD